MNASGARVWAGWLAVTVLAVSAPGPAGAQVPESVAVRGAEVDGSRIAVSTERGFGAVRASDLGVIGWSFADGADPPGPELRHDSGAVVRVRPDSPLVQWDGRPVQLVDAPFRSGGDLYLPLQFVVDLLPGLLPSVYAFDEDQSALVLAEAGGLPGLMPDASDPSGDLALGPPERDLGGAAPPEPYTPVDGVYDRLVVIDPGHGGDDPGAVGPGGEREKDVVLSLALALAQELAMRPGIEVRLTRDRDVTVPVWARGEWATAWREDRPAIFLSLHTNTLEDRGGVRGFETYVLSEARTDHERWVASVENAGADAEVPLDPDDPRLGEILRGLRAFDYAEQAALLAQEIQGALGDFHPGPDRGVRQAPLAVLAHPIMPAVLVEVGFISNREEARAMSGIAFRRSAAEAMARAIDQFFERHAAEAPSP